MSARPSANGSPVSPKPGHPNVPRLALDISEACEALGVSWAFWAEHVADEVRIVRRGRRRLVAVTELQRWLDENGERVLEGRR
jgi:hypothetical protein